MHERATSSPTWPPYVTHAPSESALSLRPALPRRRYSMWFAPFLLLLFLAALIKRLAGWLRRGTQRVPGPLVSFPAMGAGGAGGRFAAHQHPRTPKYKTARIGLSAVRRYDSRYRAFGSSLFYHAKAYSWYTQPIQRKLSSSHARPAAK